MTAIVIPLRENSRISFSMSVVLPEFFTPHMRHTAQLFNFFTCTSHIEESRAAHTFKILQENDLNSLSRINFHGTCRDDDHTIASDK